MAVLRHLSFQCQNPDCLEDAKVEVLDARDNGRGIFCLAHGEEERDRISADEAAGT